jgi:hypothetical protein
MGVRHKSAIRRVSGDLSTTGSWRPQTIPHMEWQPISTAPFDRNLELAVFDTRGRPHALVFPCRRILGGWIDAETKEKLSALRPTHGESGLSWLRSNRMLEFCQSGLFLREKAKQR